MSICVNYDCNREVIYGAKGSGVPSVYIPVTLDDGREFYAGFRRVDGKLMSDKKLIPDYEDDLPIKLTEEDEIAIWDTLLGQYVDICGELENAQVFMLRERGER